MLVKESTPSDFKTPPGSTEDFLANFQSVAIQNEFATIDQASVWHELMSAIAADLSRCCDYASGHIVKVEDPSALLLFLTANSHFLASARLAASGQCLSAFSTGRATMESALYGWYLVVTPDAAKRWYDKPTEPNERRKWGREFQFSSINSVFSETFEGPAKWAKHLHQTSIDFGAHPNKQALYSNLANFDRADGSSVLRWNVLHPWGTLAVMTAKFVIETGIFAVGVFGRTFPDADKAHGFVNAATGHAHTLKARVADTTLFDKDDS